MLNMLVSWVHLRRCSNVLAHPPNNPMPTIGLNALLQMSGLDMN